MIKKQVIRTNYFKDFQCIAEKCKADCCHGWNISVDKETYEKYMSLDELEIQTYFIDNIVLKGTETFRASTKLLDKGICAFLNGKGLCNIQLKYGHSYLSDTCRSYPRHYCSIADEIEAYLMLSCEAATKIILFRQELIKFEEKYVEEYVPGTSCLNSSKYIDSNDALSIFWKMRVTSLYILQNRTYKFWVRMVILGLFMQKANFLLSEKKAQELFTFIDDFEKNLDSGLYDNLENEIPSVNDVKLKILLSILKIHKKTSWSKETELISQALDGFKMNNYDIDYINKEYYSHYFKDKDYIFENYVVNLFLIDLYPFCGGSNESVYDNYVKLAEKYSILKFFLAGLISYHKENFNEEHIVDIVVSISRSFEHNNDKYVNQIKEFIKKYTGTSMHNLCILMKD